MPFTTARTSFLPDLDLMIQQDRQGAIMDMLQILRESGVISTANARDSERRIHLSDFDDGYKDAVKMHLARQIGNLATERAELKMFATENPPEIVWSLEAEFVLRDKI